MPQPSLASVSFLCLVLGCCVGAAVAQGAAPSRQPLPVPGEVFDLDGHTAFVIEPKGDAARAVSRPWVFYAPTFDNLPGKAEAWMFERFVAAGIGIAGVDVGESYGSPAGRAVYDALHRRLVDQRGWSSRPVLLARSRGGLMLYAWAADHPQHTAGVAGIYPVCDLRSYPGLERAAPAYGLDAAGLEAALARHNPVDRLAPLAKHGVPVLHLQGDADRTVPLEQNSAELARRYRALGGLATVEVIAGGGHDMEAHWFHSQRLVDFVIARCRLPAGTTRGIVDTEAARCPDGGLQLVSDTRSLLVPEEQGASNWTFADGELTASKAWESVVTPASYRDFRMHVEFNVNASDQEDAEARGNSGVYLQRRYEVQILDSFGIAPEDYEASYCGSLYRMRKPDAIAARPAGEWQRYDIVFRAARFDGDQKVANARVTVVHNGVLVHDDVEMPRKTGAGRNEGPDPQPIRLQGHGNPVRFRNVWIQALDLDGR